MTDHETDTTAAVRTAARAHQRDMARAEASRTELIDAIVTALRQGDEPGHVTAASGWTGAQVRKIARAHGIEASDRYQRATDSSRRTAASKLGVPVAPAVASASVAAQLPPPGLRLPAKVAGLSAERARVVASRLRAENAEWVEGVAREVDDAPAAWRDHVQVAAALGMGVLRGGDLPG